MDTVSIRRRGLWFALAGVPLLGIVLIPRIAGSGDLSATSRTECDPLPIVRILALLPDGSEQTPVDGDGLGRRYYFALDGGTVTQVVPPARFVPVSASDAELETYGIPQRPRDADARARWNQDWARWHSSEAVGLCRSEFSN